MNKRLLGPSNADNIHGYRVSKKPKPLEVGTRFATQRHCKTAKSQSERQVSKLKSSRNKRITSKPNASKNLVVMDNIEDNDETA